MSEVLNNPGVVRVRAALQAAGVAAANIREPVGIADAAFVRERTGFAIGGVAPVGHATRVASYVEVAA